MHNLLRSLRPVEETMTVIGVTVNTVLQSSVEAECQSGFSGSVGAIFVAHDLVLPTWFWACGLLHILLPSANSKQLICVCVCIALWIKLTKASNCAAHGLLASDPSWSLV